MQAFIFFFLSYLVKEAVIYYNNPIDDSINDTGNLQCLVMPNRL